MVVGKVLLLIEPTRYPGSGQFGGGCTGHWVRFDAIEVAESVAPRHVEEEAHVAANIEYAASPRQMGLNEIVVQRHGAPRIDFFADRDITMKRIHIEASNFDVIEDRA